MNDRKGLRAGIPAPRRAVTDPTASNRWGKDAMSSAVVETLYQHPDVKIVSFSSLPNQESSEHDNGPPPYTWPVMEHVIAVGKFRVFRAPGSVAFLSCGSALQPILPKSQCWCMNDEGSTFVLQIRPSQYWKIELSRSNADEQFQAKQFRDTLDKILLFEKTPCPLRLPSVSGILAADIGQVTHDPLLVPLISHSDQQRVNRLDFSSSIPLISHSDQQRVNRLDFSSSTSSTQRSAARHSLRGNTNASISQQANTTFKQSDEAYEGGGDSVVSLSSPRLRYFRGGRQRRLSMTIATPSASRKVVTAIESCESVQVENGNTNSTAVCAQEPSSDATLRCSKESTTAEVQEEDITVRQTLESQLSIKSVFKAVVGVLGQVFAFLLWVIWVLLFEKPKRHVAPVRWHKESGQGAR